MLQPALGLLDVIEHDANADGVTPLSDVESFRPLSLRQRNRVQAVSGRRFPLLPKRGVPIGTD
jgi:hypothetical protein